MDWFVKLLLTGVRYLLLFLDIIVYALIDFFYELFFAVSKIRLFSNNGGMIDAVADRVYALIGIYALFKVVFILINTLINPDNMNDKQKNPGKIAVRVVVMLALIIAVPWCFDYAYKIQDAIVSENIISKIILGVDEEPSDSDTGSKISSIIFSGFITIDENVLEDTNAEDPYNESNITDGNCKDSAQAVSKLRSGTGKISDLKSHIGTTYNSNDGDQFCINYQFIISMIAGGFAAYMFAVYCLDLGLRVAKMAFYELVAPVPIVTYIDGKKDGAFNNWLKSVISAYADIFLRLIIINFVVFIIQNGISDIMTLEALKDFNFVTRNFAKIIVVLGLLMFATQAPKLIKDLFGIKGEGGDYGLSLGKKLAAAPAAAGAVGLAAAGGAAVAAKVGKEASNIKAGWKGADPNGGIGAKLKAAASASTAGRAANAVNNFGAKNADVLSNPMLSGKEKAGQIATNFWNAGKTGLKSTAGSVSNLSKSLVSGAMDSVSAATASGGKKAINPITIGRNSVNDKALKSSRTADAWKKHVYGAGGTQEQAANAANKAAETQASYQSALNTYGSKYNKMYNSAEDAAFQVEYNNAVQDYETTVAAYQKAKEQYKIKYNVEYDSGTPSNVEVEYNNAVQDYERTFNVQYNPSNPSNIEVEYNNAIREYENAYGTYDPNVSGLTMSGSPEQIQMKMKVDEVGKKFKAEKEAISKIEQLGKERNDEKEARSVIEKYNKTIEQSSKKIGKYKEEQKDRDRIKELHGQYTTEQSVASDLRAKHEKAVTDMGKAKEYDADQRAKAGIVKKPEKMKMPDE